MLGFLNTIVLIGLIGIGLPVIIHLFARQRKKKIFFSTTAFIKQIHGYRLKRIKIRQLLLLLLRCLAVFFLVMAFARPTLRGRSKAIQGEGESAIVILIDRSLSMSRQGFPEQVDRWVQTVLGLVKDQDGVAVVSTVAPREAEPVFLHNRQLVERKLRQKLAGFAAGDIKENLNSAHALLARSKALNKEVYFITDLQAGEFTDRPDSSLLDNWSYPLFILPVQGETNNVAITETGIENTILQPQNPIRIFAEIANYGNREIQNLLARGFVEDQVMSQKVIDLKPGEKRRIGFPMKINQTGWVRCKIQIDDDPFLYDNERMLVFRIPGTIRVLLLGRHPDSICPLELALRSAQGTSRFFRLKRMFYGQPWTETLDAVDVIFISDIPDFRPDEADRLKTFVESGGGVFFILGENVHTDNYNRLFFEPLAGIRLGDVTGIPQSESRGYFSLRSLDIKHPLFEGVFQTDIAKFQPLHFYRVVNLSGKNLESVLSLQDRRCLLGEISLGKGKLFILTSSLDPQWSDLAYSSLFPPLAYRSVLYLSRWSGIEESIPVGRQIAVPVDSGNVQSKYRVEFPDGDEVVLIPDLRQKRFVLNLEEVPMQGFYHFYEDEKLICVKAANVDPVESDFRTVTRQELVAYFKPVDCRIVSEHSRLARQVSITRHGRELWKEMLILAMAVLILEMVLMRESRFQNPHRKMKSQERNL